VIGVDFLFFCLLTVQVMFFSTATLCTNFLNLLSAISTSTWLVCSGPLCGDLPSLGGTVQRKRLQILDVDACAEVFEPDSLELNACSDTVLHTAAFGAVDRAIKESERE